MSFAPTIACNNCGRVLSRRATRCPSCNTAVDEQRNLTTPTEASVQTQRSSSDEARTKPERPVAQASIVKTNVDEEFLRNYMSIEEFATATSTTVEDVIENVRDRKLVGQYRNHKWFVRKGQISSENAQPRPTENIRASVGKPHSNYIAADLYSHSTGTSVDDVIQRIRDGELVGEIRDGSWYVQTEPAPSDSDDDGIVKRQSIYTHRTTTIDVPSTFKQNRFAFAGLALGILSFFVAFFLFIPLGGLALSILGLKRANESGIGRTMSLWGVGVNLVYSVMGWHHIVGLESEVIGLLLILAAVAFFSIMVVSKPTK